MDGSANRWLTAACCHDLRDGSDARSLPPAYRTEIGRLALVAIASTAFFLVAPYLLAPLASRSLSGAVSLPRGHNTPQLRPARIPTADAATTAPVLVSRREIRRPRPVIAVALVEPAAILAPAARPARRGNVFSRFFRGLARSFQTPAKVDATN